MYCTCSYTRALIGVAKGIIFSFVFFLIFSKLSLVDSCCTAIGEISLYTSLLPTALTTHIQQEVRIA